VNAPKIAFQLVGLNAVHVAVASTVVLVVVEMLKELSGACGKLQYMVIVTKRALHRATSGKNED
jgi:hypothetical protein